MELTEDQYETLQTIFPDHAIDVFSDVNGLTIKVWSNEDDQESLPCSRVV